MRKLTHLHTSSQKLVNLMQFFCFLFKSAHHCLMQVDMPFIKHFFYLILKEKRCKMLVQNQIFQNENVLYIPSFSAV